MNEEESRVQSYLLSQGQKYSFIELLPRVIKSRIALIDEVSDVDQDCADFAVSDTEWTISEILHHVTLSEIRVRGVIQGLVSGNKVDALDVDPPREIASKSIEDQISDLTHGLVQWCKMTELLPRYAPVKFTAKHGFFGELHAGAWFLFQRVHDLDHANQVKSVKTNMS